MTQAQNALLQWYEQYGRHDLPWRNTSELYHIYLSEVMLQQTQVSRVQEEYYPRFLKHFPTLKSLANASLEEVLSLWSGLGYYSRAKNLHKTAQLCADSGLPHSTKELEKLPGIGAYTASAICCFGLSQTIPVVDTNIKRVLKRFFALENVSEKEIWQKAASFVNHAAPRDHNLALMDLGAMVCSVKTPKCHNCPLKRFCQGKNEPMLYTKTKKKKYIEMELFFGIWIKDNKIALTRSKEKMYHNMLVFPQIDPCEENFIGSYKHSYTKYKLTVKLYRIEHTLEDVEWLEIKDLEKAPISSLTKKALRFLM